MVAAHGNAGGMNLRVAGVGERRALLVRTPRGRRVRQHGVRAEVKHVAIPARGEHHGIRRVRRDLAGEQVARHDPARMPVDDDHVEHFFERVHLHALEGDLALERRIRAEQQLLPLVTRQLKRSPNAGQWRSEITHDWIEGKGWVRITELDRKEH